MIIKMKLLWFPTYHQIFIHGEESKGWNIPDKHKYLRSVWIGLTAPILSLPTAVMTIILNGGPVLPTLTKLLLMSFIGFPLLGLRWHLYGLDVSVDEALSLHELGF